MSKATPDVTVVVFSYNCAPYIGKTIESVLAQDGVSFELIVVDDKSTDNTVEVLEQYRGRPFFRYEVNPKNLGVVDNYNKSIDMGSGRYVVALGSDDILYPGHLKSLFDAMEACPRAALAYTQCNWIDENDALIRHAVHPGHTPQSYCGGRDEIVDLLRFDNYITPSSVMLRRSIFDRIRLLSGGLCMPDRLAGDWELWMRIARVAPDFIFLRQATVGYRIHQGQISKNFYSSERPLAEHTEFLELYLRDEQVRPRMRHSAEGIWRLYRQRMQPYAPEVVEKYRARAEAIHKALFAEEAAGGANVDTTEDESLAARIYQIFYSEESHKGLDGGFIPLDNTGQRPDWYEFWPMRSFLLNNALQESAFYGFLSPKFREKTGLDATQVHAFMETVDASADVVTLSPFFDAGALFDNVFKQGANEHPDIWPVFVECAAMVAPGVNLDTLLMDSTNSVFCNYFLAKPRFWRHWLERAERLFILAEQNKSDLARALNAPTRHNNADNTPVKVFVIERLVSLILATEPQWQVRNFNPMPLPFAYPRTDKVKPGLALLDALKIAARQTGRSEFVQAYGGMRAQVIQQLNSAG
ncbi:MAG TPA: glycosyltransferase [Rhodocyclaceae bacterium]|nr:glycosyltransferase [Rhodocyclaceae bacterium]